MDLEALLDAAHGHAAGRRRDVGGAHPDLAVDEQQLGLCHLRHEARGAECEQGADGESRRPQAGNDGRRPAAGSGEQAHGSSSGQAPAI